MRIPSLAQLGNLVRAKIRPWDFTISPSHPQYVVDCDKVASLPSIGFSMAGHTFELTGQEYILEVSGLEWNLRLEWNGDSALRFLINVLAVTF